MLFMTSLNLHLASATLHHEWLHREAPKLEQDNKRYLNLTLAKSSYYQVARLSYQMVE